MNYSTFKSEGEIPSPLTSGKELIDFFTKEAISIDNFS